MYTRDCFQARFQRGLVLMKQGEIEQAKIDFYHVVSVCLLFLVVEKCAYD